MKNEYNQLLEIETTNNQQFFKDTVCEGKNFIGIMSAGQIAGFEISESFEDGSMKGILLIGGGFECVLHKPDFVVMSSKLANSIITMYTSLENQKELDKKNNHIN